MTFTCSDERKSAFTSYVNRCTSRRITPNLSKSERNFLISYIVPSFEALAFQTDLLCFEWGEIQLKHMNRVLIDIGKSDPASLRFVDGLGYDVNDDERFILEASGDSTLVSQQHANDDTLNMIHSLMCLLKRDARCHLHGSIETYKKVKVFGIQTVKTTMILSEMFMDQDLRYVYKEPRAVEIPVKDHHRSKWLPIADLLAYLITQLDNRLNIMETLQKEHDGKLHVECEDTIRTILFTNAASCEVMIPEGGNGDNEDGIF